MVISGVFFGGKPKDLLQSVSRGGLDAYVSDAILEEYNAIVREMTVRNKGKLHEEIYQAFLDDVTVIQTVSHVEICRDPDDNKFLSCAKDAKALYIVSGDKDLLDIRQFEGIQVVTVKEFCERYLAHGVFLPDEISEDTGMGAL